MRRRRRRRAPVAYPGPAARARADRTGSCATEDPSNDESGCRFPESAIAAGLDRAVSARASSTFRSVARIHRARRCAPPLRVARGGIDLTLPVAYDYETGAAAFGRRTYNLAPAGRELVVEASYALPLFGGDFVANIWWRRDPGHIAAIPDDRGTALRFTLGL